MTAGPKNWQELGRIGRKNCGRSETDDGHLMFHRWAYMMARQADGMELAATDRAIAAPPFRSTISVLVTAVATRDAACAYFRAVLGPHYNKLHANHCHLDMGPYRICG
jgi:hypothetical protein